jgi:hypothetical protein
MDIEIEIVKNVIIALNNESGKVWASFVDIAKICEKKHRLIITKDFFKNNQHFRIYRTSNSSELYVSLFENLDIYLVKKITGKPKLINQFTNVKKTQPKPIIPNLKLVKRLPFITSCDDLEKALIGILKDLAATSDSNAVEIIVLAKYFCQVYGSPIKPVINSLIPDLNLIEFLQCSNELIVKNLNGKWVICLK